MNHAAEVSPPFIIHGLAPVESLPQVLAAPVFEPEVPADHPTPGSWDKLLELHADVRQREAELQSILTERTPPGGVPRFMATDFGRLRLELLAAERLLHQHYGAAFRFWQGVAKDRKAEADQAVEAIGKEIFDGLVELGFEAEGVNADYQTSRYGSFSELVQSHPRYRAAIRESVRWHEQVGGHGYAASDQERFAKKCEIASKRIVESARAAVGL